MQRRQFVTSASATIAAASIAGCSGILGGDGGGNSGPKGAVRTHIEAGVGGDQTALNESLHPNASAGVLMGAAVMSEFGDASIQNLEIVSESENEATVRATVEASSDGETQEGNSTYVVRKHDGEWKVYAMQS